MKKKIIIGFLAFLVLAGITCFVYIKKVFLPVKLKEIILTRSEQFLGRRITYDKIDYHFIKGIVLENLTVYDKEDEFSPFIQVQQLRLNILITPILREKKIIIPSLIITQPYVHIVRQDEATWNFSDLLDKRAHERQSPLGVFLSGITIDKGRIELTDKTPDTPTTEKFQNINFKADLSVKSGIKFQFDAQGPANALISTSGNFELIKKALTAEVKIQNFDLFKYLNMFYNNPLIVHRHGIINNANLKIKTNGLDIDVAGNMNLATPDLTVSDKTVSGDLFAVAELQISKKNNSTHAAGNVVLKNAKLTLANQESFAGDLTAQGLELTIDEKRADLKAKVDIPNAEFLLGPDRTIKGHLSAKELSFKRKDTVLGLKSDLLAENTELSWNNSHFKGTWSTPEIILTSVNGEIEAKSEFEVQSADFTIANQTMITGDLKAKKTTLTFNKNKKLDVTTAFLLENSQINMGQDKKISGTIKAEETAISFANPTLTANGHFLVSQGYFALPQNREFIANPVIDLKITHTLNSQLPLLYSGSLILEDGTLKGLPRVDQVQGIKGTVTFTNDKIFSDFLRLKTLGTDMVLAGTLQNFKAPDVDIEASMSDVDLEKIRPYFAEALDKYKLSPSGRAELKLRYKGAIDSPKLAHVKFSADLKEAALTGEKLPGPITHISGKINYSSQGVSWERLKGIFKNKSYTLNGQWIGDENPFIETTIEGPQLNLATKIQSQKDGVYKILSFKGLYDGSSFDVKGNFNLAGGAPDVNLSVQGNLDLKNLALLIPNFQKKIESYKPTGTLALNASLIGKLKDWRQCQMTADGSSQAITANGFRFKDVSLKLEHGKFPTSQLDIAAVFYNGQLQVTSFIDPRKNDLPLSLAANLKDTDLSVLAADINTKGKNIKETALKGNLALDFTLDGPLTRAEKWKGRGSAAITDGQIFKFNLLKGIWRTLLIPEFEDIIFTHARTNFEIQNKRLITHDFILSSSAADLSATGWVDFDQNLNLNVSPSFKELTILRSASLKKGPTALLAQAQGYINIKISGTLKKPNYSVSTQPVKAIEKTTGALIEGVQGILEDIIN